MHTHCNGRCEAFGIKKRGIQMYQDHVYCSTCAFYFRKPYPITCLCCSRRVRVKSRNTSLKAHGDAAIRIHGTIRREIAVMVSNL